VPVLFAAGVAVIAGVRPSPGTTRDKGAR
jgi:hypothetical protein